MNIDHALVSKIITTGQLEEAISRGIRDDLFADEECQDMFRYLRGHLREYGVPPSLAAVKEDKPDFEWEHLSDPLDWVIDKFVNNAKRRLANDLIPELADACDDSERSKNIDIEFLEVARKLAQLVPSRKLDRFSDMERRIDDYEKRAREDEPLGIQFGFPTLDALTGGIQSHEFVTVLGFSGLGKSTLLWNLAFNCWAQGKTPLYISLEMEAGTLLRKFDAMAAELDYYALKHLKLDDEAIKNWRKKAAEIKESVADIPIIDSIRHCTPDHIFAETVRHKPDLVVVDYLSLMRSSSVSRGVSIWQSLTEITQDLKQNARTLKIPILAAAQSNRSGSKDGAELDNVGYSISVVQDSDIIIGLHADDEMKEQNLMEIRLRKNRDGPLKEFMAHWKHDEMLYRERTVEEKAAATWTRNGNGRQEEPPMEITPTPAPAVRTRKRPGS
jgi:replicative DNA helicase